MDRFGKIFTDPAWWMSAVVVALVVSVIANFMTRWTDRLLGRFSERRRKAMASRRRIIEQTADRLMENESALIHFEAQYTRYTIRSIAGAVLLALVGLGIALSISVSQISEYFQIAFEPIPVFVICAITLTAVYYRWDDASFSNKYDDMKDVLREIEHRIDAEIAKFS